MASYTVKLSLGPLCLRAPFLENQEQNIGFDLHFVYLKPKYNEITDPREKEIIDSKITYFLDYFPSTLYIKPEAKSFEKIQKLRKFQNAKNTFEEVSQELRSIYGNDTVLYWTVPRKGLITGWSLRVSIVMQNGELDSYIHRIEVAYVFVMKKDSIPYDENKLISSLVHSQLYVPFKNDDYPIYMNKHIHHTSLATVPMAKLPENFASISLEDKISYFKNLLSNWDIEVEPFLVKYLAENYLDKFKFKKFNENAEDFFDFTSAELMMFALINSEHCRHHLFKSKLTIDGITKPHSLFDMIKNTYIKNKEGVITAYDDNSAVISGYNTNRYLVDYKTKRYTKEFEMCNYLIKAETHNYPTAISPFDGASTGAGGEIRDEAATGIGSRSTMGFTGFMLSNLNIPGFSHPWEYPFSSNLIEKTHPLLNSTAPNYLKDFFSKQKPPYPLADGYKIISNATSGSCAYSNEYGRPVVAGFFRTYTEATKYKDSAESVIFGYHKPVMLCGGLGMIRPQHIKKKEITPGDYIIMIGSPVISVGIGDGASSSKTISYSGEQPVITVPNSNGLVGRICQSVINLCCSRGIESPILSIHDVGAGGFSNAIPELVNNCGFGAEIDLNAVPSDDAEMTATDVLCTESQERYVAVIEKNSIELFKEICEREKCIYGIIGKVTEDKCILAHDSTSEKIPVGMSLDFLFADKCISHRVDSTREIETSELVIPESVKIRDIISLLLKVPAVASKSFIISISDRSVGGLIARDQFVGPWQVPVADCAVSFSSFDGYKGFAMALGEKPLLSPINPAASARMAVCEAITNIYSADVQGLNSLKIGANWMVDSSTPGMISSLYKAVEAIGMELCPDLKIVIPVGKDSTSMSMSWQLEKENNISEKNSDKTVTSHNVSVKSPVTVVISAYSSVNDTRKTITPQLADCSDPTVILFIDLAMGNQRMGGSCVSQIFNTITGDCPDVCDLKKTIIPFTMLLSELRKDDPILEVLAYHDRSDGGLFTSIMEMCFAGNKGCYIDITTMCKNPINTLFNEELGVLLQIRERDMFRFVSLARSLGIDSDYVHFLGSVNESKRIVIANNDEILIDESIVDLYKEWSVTSTYIKSQISREKYADMDYNNIDHLFSGPGLSFDITYDIEKLQNLPLPPVLPSLPKVAILREVGINGHEELSYSFYLGGFDCYDVQMHDIESNKVSLSDFSGIAIGGGFTHGDVLGPGAGWAKAILTKNELRHKFKVFFERNDTFSIGFCNGCQFLTQLKEIIPGASSWPYFGTNKSGVFESRLIRMKIAKNPNSIFLKDMGSSIIVAPAAHAIGMAYFPDPDKNDVSKENPALSNTVMTYVDNNGNHADHDYYPYNPSSSIFGIAALSSDDGRSLVMMPHPERVHRMYQHTWGFEKVSSQADKFSSLEYSPSVKMYTNAYEWVCSVKSS